MRIHTLILVILFAPISLWSQTVVSDTIRLGESPAKYSIDVIFETTIDTVQTIVINEILARNAEVNVDNAGDYDDWFEVYNYGDIPIKMNDLWFSDNPVNPFKWQINTSDPIYLDPGQYMLIWADEEQDEGYNHASFKLSGSGEYLSIWDKDSSLIDEIQYGEQTSNISYGRYPNGGHNWQYFTDPSPEKNNDSNGGESILPKPVASHSGGIYQEPFSLKLTTEIPGCEIRYTLDCSEPGYLSPLFADSIEISETTIVRARLMKTGHLDGKILNISLLFEEHLIENPIVSLVSEHNNFYGVSGLISTNSRTIEIPAHFEYIERGIATYSGGTGIQNHSVKSTKPNSLRLYARSRYGTDWFEHAFFDDKAPASHKRLVLRNSGNDNVNRKVSNSHFRDPLASTIAKASNDHALISATRPVNVFVNGKYFGLFNLRERIDEYYIETHTTETENYDLLERSFGYGRNRNAIVGSYKDWDALLKFVDTTGNLKFDADFQYVDSQVDIINFTDYWITEVFLGNYDWLSNNIKFWKSEHGKWQWIYWDMDHSLGLVYHDFGNPDWNTLNWSLSFSDRAWSNGFNNILIRNLLLNESYKEFFIKRFTHLLNTSFSYKSTRSIAEKMRTAYQGDIELHAAKWERNIEDWKDAYGIIDNYLSHRPVEQFKHIQDVFDLENQVEVSLKCIPPEGGSLSMDDYIITTDTYSGKYFPKMKYDLNPNPISGYKLHDIRINGKSTDSTSVYLTGDTDITAVFIRENFTAPVTISEVYFNNREAFDSGDWIEFCNYGLDTFDISGAQIIGSEEKIVYTFESGTMIAPEQYFVVSQNKNKFQAIYPEGIHCFGDLEFEINDSAKICLQSAEGSIYSQIRIKSNSDWPRLPLQGYSIELGNLIHDPVVGENWFPSTNQFGSPGIPNQLYYVFHRPSGKDSVFNNQESIVVPFASSGDFYFDWDNHDLAAIYVNSVDGPGKISAGVKTVVSNEQYEANDFIFEPGEQNNKATEFSYYFIDRSGQRSKKHIIKFSNLTSSYSSALQALKHYPSPANNEFFIEFPGVEQNQLEFNLFDISGKNVEEITLSEFPGKVCVNIQTLSSGIYIYRVKMNDNNYYGKIKVVK